MTATMPSATGSDPTTTPPVTPEPVMKIAAGFMAAKHLFAASELGLFEALADTPATIEALGARTGLTVRTARISADAMVALGFLERSEETYRNSPVAATFLTGRTPADLRPFLRFWDQVSYPAWTELASALASGPTREIFDLDDELQEVASAGIEAVLAGPAAALPHAVDLDGQRSLLDIGGGTGSWSVAAVKAVAGLRATVLDLPVVAALARDRIADAGLGSRIEAVGCDVMADELPTEHDTFLLANFVHYWSPEENRAFLSRVRRVAPPNARLLLADFWTNPAHTEPVHAALMAGEFAVHLEHTPLAGPQSLVVAEPAEGSTRE